MQSLRASTRPDPRPGPGQVVLRVRAVCLNHRDLLMVGGSYGPRRSDERVPVSDGVPDGHHFVQRREAGDGPRCSVGKNLVLRGITAGSRSMLDGMVKTVATANAAPVIDRTFTFDRAPLAYAHLRSGGRFGKVMVRVA